MDIPIEILSHVFSFLSSSDLKNVRLTCYEWNLASQNIEVSAKEKMVISNENRLNNATDCLKFIAKLGRRSLNLDFRKFEFSMESVLFWEHCGARCHYLAFRNVMFRPNSFELMLQNCMNLHTLIFDSCDDALIIDTITTSIEKLCSLKVERRLVTLKLKNCPTLVTDSFFSNIMNVFPLVQRLNFKNLNINYHKQVEKRFYRNPESEKLASNYIFTFRCIFHHLRLNAEKITHLCIKNSKKDSQIGLIGITPIWLNNLARVSNLKLNGLKLEGHNHISDKQFSDLISSQNYLQHLCIYSCIKLSSHILRIISTCSNLKYFKVKLSCHDSYVEFLKVCEELRSFYLQKNVDIIVIFDRENLPLYYSIKSPK